MLARVLWHTPFAVSGQQYFAPQRILTFTPVVPRPYALPVLIPNALGRLDAIVVVDDGGGTVQYTLLVALGEIVLDVLEVDGVAAPVPLRLMQGQSVTWSGKVEVGMHTDRVNSRVVVE